MLVQTDLWHFLYLNIPLYLLKSEPKRSFHSYLVMPLTTNSNNLVSENDLRWCQIPWGSPLNDAQIFQLATNWRMFCMHFSSIHVKEHIARKKLGLLVYCIPRTKYARGILWFSRCYAAASADTSSFSR